MKYSIPTLLLGLLLAVVSLIGYHAASTPFFLDDIDELNYVHGIHGLPGCFSGDCYGLFRPIKNLIFYSVSTFMSESARAGHMLSFVLYLLTTAIVFWWFKRWFCSLAWALLATSIWALAPTQVNHLTWLSSANILVAICGAVGALCTYDLSREYRTQGSKRLAGLCALICLLAYWIALLAYEGAIMLPGLILLLDWTRQRGLASKHHLVIYGALFASALGFICLRWSIVPPPIDNPAIVTPSKFHLAFVSAYFSMAHLWTWLAPFGRQEILGTFVWGKTTSGLILMSAWALLALLVGLAVRLKRRWPDLALGIFWFLIAFLPMSNLIPFENGPFCDYYIPLPSIGLVIVLVAVLRRLVRTWQLSHAGTFMRLACTAAIVLTLSWRGAAATEAFEWLKTWKNPDKLYQQSMRLRPYSFRARANLAPLLMQRGLYAEAEELARQCVDQAPWTAMHFGLLADIQRARGNPESARYNYMKVIELSPEDRYARFSLATLCEQDLADPAVAMREYTWLLQIDWHQYSAQSAINLARMYAKLGQHAQMIQILEQALRKRPSCEEVQQELSAMLAQTGKCVQG